MFRPLGPPPASRPVTGRRGAILIVVLALLALFLVIAITFVFYADSEATVNRVYREGQDSKGGAGLGGGSPDPVNTINQFLLNWIYDTADTNANNDLINALRGHSLAATMYGRIPGGGMYNGVGTIHESPNPPALPPGAPPSPFSLTDRALFVNYTNMVLAGNEYIFDPEWTGGYRLSAWPPSTPSQQAPTLAAPVGRKYLAKNAPYTYPDLNNFFLAAVSPATGEVLSPSFFRHWHFNPNNPFGQGGANSNNPWTRLGMWDPRKLSGTSLPGSEFNTDWVTADGRAKCLRPRPIDQLTANDVATYNSTQPPASQLPFPLPADPTTGLTATQQAALFDLMSGPNGLITTGKIIPYPMPNADGSFTGDVQNLVAGVGVVKSDSVLLDIGLPSVQWKMNGQLTWIKPLVAVLIRDLDPLVNLNAAGNVKNGGSHVSYAGYGPWEINPNAILANGPEANLIASARYGPGGVATGRTGVTSMPYDRAAAAIFGQYAQVNWDATGAPGAPPIQVPGFGGTPNPFQTVPIYGPGSAGFWDNNTAASKAQNHPSLYNAGDWAPLYPTWSPSGATTPFAYPLSDLRRLSLKYADTLDSYNETTLSRFPPANRPNDLVGSYGYAATPSKYRTDPAHARRALFTTYSAGFELPRLPGNFNTVQQTPSSQALQLGTTSYPNLPVYPAGYPGSFPTGSPGTISDFGATDLRNQRSGIGPVDLNRPLADYRDLVNPNNPTPNGNPNFTGGVLNPVPLSSTNMGNLSQAWADRHNLARDIFARLVVATGALASVDSAGNVTVQATAGSAEYNALRALAQIAINAVDSIDKDDVSTLFVWNPTGGALTEQSAGSIATFVGASTKTPAEIQNRAVFGVEKPRLVINEAYGELTNDPAEMLPNNLPANNNFRVRFWVELMNPAAPPYPAGVTSGPLGDGSVTVYGPNNPYQLVITRENVGGGAVSATLRDPANVTGNLTTTPPPDLTFDFSTATPPQRVITPANGDWAYTSQPNSTKGFVLVGPSMFTNSHNDAGGNPIEFNPNTGAAPYNRMIAGTAAPPLPGTTTTAMEYDFGSKPAAATLEDTTNAGMRSLRRNVVALRRLANPYLAFDAKTNPYVTVDYMDWVPAFDAVTRGGGAGDTTNRTAKTMAGGVGFDPVDNTNSALRRFAVGKVQPYAGFAVGTPVPVSPGTGAMPAISGFPNSLVIAQNPSTPPLNGQPKHTFFQNNGVTTTGPTPPTNPPTPPSSFTTVVPPAQALTSSGMPIGSVTTPPTTPETIMAPFDWFVHFDRPLVNQLELLSLQAGKPHEVTQLFIQPPLPSPPNPAGQPVQKNLGLVPWLGIQPTATPNVYQPGFDTTNRLTHNGLYRALDLLRVKPWGYGESLGGRVYGRINLNTVQDPRIFSAVLDPQGGNVFNSGDVNNLWTRLISVGPGARTSQTASKTQADGTTTWTIPVPGPTVDDLGSAAGPTADRPFKGFGVPEFTSGGMAAQAGSGLQDTLLRPPVAPAWTGSTSYSVGQYVIANGNAYVCTTAGTSGPPAGGGPSGNGTGIVDGGAVWNFYWPASQPLASLLTQSHPYMQAEMPRKMLNNVTTVSNTFAVTMTIVYHKVRVDGSGNKITDLSSAPRELLGPEVYQQTPGDMRQQFFAVVDRSNLAVSGGSIVPRPFYAAVDQPAYAGPTANLYLSNAVFAAATPLSNSTLTVFADGQPVTISLNTQLLVGTGANQETVAVTGFNSDGSMIVAPVAPSTSTRPHAAGECVAISIPGIPGTTGGAPNPPASCDLWAAGAYNPGSKFRWVVPYLAQVK